MIKKEIQQEIVSKIVAQMEKAGKNWVKPWNGAGGMPLRFNRTAYQGINTWILWAESLEKKYKSRTWGTFKQINQAGGKIIKGEKHTKVIYMQPALYRDAKPGEKAREDGSVQVQYNLMRWYQVYNLDQTTLTDEELDESKTGNAVTLPSVEDYIKNTGADVRIDNDLYENACYYVPSKDYIGMVDKDKFRDTQEGGSATANYYATLLHELTHWTKKEDRCNRQYKEKYFEDFKSNEIYAFEELVAELGSVIQTQMLGITSAPTKHAAQYLNIWLGRIKEKPDTFFKASAMAQKAVNYVLSFQPKKVVEKNIEKNISIAG